MCLFCVSMLSACISGHVLHMFPPSYNFADCVLSHNQNMAMEHILDDPSMNPFHLIIVN